MKLEQFTLPLSTRVDINTGLKATAITTILAVSHTAGVLMGIYCIDPDDLAQNERLQIVIDDVPVFDDAAYDIPNTDEFLSLVASLAKGSAVAGTRVNTDIGQVGHNMLIPFDHNLEIAYSRAAAGTTGLTINIVYAVRSDGVH